MKITAQDVRQRLENNEDVYVYGTTVNIVKENWNSSPHISNNLKPIFGEVRKENRKLMFFKENARGTGFVSTGRNFDGLTCFSDEMEAINFYNNKLREFINIKENEIEEAKKLLVS